MINSIVDGALGHMRKGRTGRSVEGDWEREDGDHTKVDHEGGKQRLGSRGMRKLNSKG